MALIWDEAKRQWTLRHRGIDFADAELVFAGPHFDRPDDRVEYGGLSLQVGLRDASSFWFGRQEGVTAELSV